MFTRNNDIYYVEKIPKCDKCISLARFYVSVKQDETHSQEEYLCDDCVKSIRIDCILETKSLVVRENKSRYRR